MSDQYFFTFVWDKGEGESLEGVNHEVYEDVTFGEAGRLDTLTGALREAKATGDLYFHTEDKVVGYRRLDEGVSIAMLTSRPRSPQEARALADAYPQMSEDLLSLAEHWS